MNKTSTYDIIFFVIYMKQINSKLNIYLYKASIPKKICIKRIDKILKSYDISDIKDLILDKNRIFNDLSIESNNKHVTKYLNNFLNVLKDNFNENSLNLYNDNISFLEIYFYKRIYNIYSSISRTEGIYLSEYNYIKLFKNKVVPYIYHELFHLASNGYFKNKSSLGFQCIIDKNIFGYSLNEGYTELLTERYFKGYDKQYSRIYNLEKGIAKKIEEIIGKDKMQNMYLQADLKSLIKELEKYTTKDVMKFINNLDILSHFENNKIYKKVANDVYIDKIKEVYSFLSECYLNKLALELTDNDIINRTSIAFNNEILDLFDDKISDKIFESEKVVKK